MVRSKAKSLPEEHQQQAMSPLDSELCDLQEGCAHYTYEGTVHLEKALLDVLTSNHSEHCALCPKEEEEQQKKKGTLCPKEEEEQQQKKKKTKKKGSGAAKVQKKIDMWVCLTCNGHFCVAALIEANSHSRVHAKETQHWWAANYSDPSTVYCFKCDREVPVKIPNLDKNVRTSEIDLTFRIQGLRSLGTESPFNAILQNLLSLKSLRKEMLKLEFPRTATIPIALRKLFVMTSWSAARGAPDQEGLLSLICAAYPNYRMLDSEESFSCLLDALHKEEKEAWAGVPIAANSTVIDSVFGGQFSVTVSCNECPHRFSEDKQFFYLSIPVSSSRPSAFVPPANYCAQPADVTDIEVDEINGPISLENCLKLYTDPEPWICEKCTNRERPKDEEEIRGCNKGAAVRRVLIRVPPPVLALHLKRFNKDCQDQSEKLKGHVQYNENLDIGPFMDPRSEVDGHINYHLAGIVLHSENMTGGHFIANVRAEKSTMKGGALVWFNAIDKQVTRTRIRDFQGEPHLLFYRKVTPDNLRKEDMKAIEQANNNKQGQAAQKEMPCQEAVLSHMDNLVKEDMKVIEEANNNKQGQAAQKEMPCKEAILHHIEIDPVLKVKTPQPLALEMVEGSHRMSTNGNVIRGLPNLTNSCFFNVMLQCLLGLDTLRCKLLAHDVWRGSLSEPLQQLFIETGALNSAQGLLDPSDLFKHTCMVFPRFGSKQHEDTHELLRQFLGRLHVEEVKTRNLPIDIVDDVSTIITSIFSGSLVTTVSAIGCAHGSTKHDSFLDISLAIPSRGCVSIEDCWTLLTEQSAMDEEWPCPDCTCEQKEPVKRNEKGELISVKRNAVQRMLIARPPQVLVVTLKRFTYCSSRSEKLKVDVRFKEMFDMQPFMENRSMEANSLYRLVGVVQHQGTLAQGHYVAYVRANKMGSQMNNNGDSKSWYYASDENVLEAFLDQVLSSEPYILFYEKSQLTDINTEPHSSANPTVEETQLQTGAPVSDLSSPPLDELRPWEYQRSRNPHRQARNETYQDNDLLGQKVGVFLNSFILPGDTSLYYHWELIMMCERGSGSRKLNIHYSHLLTFSKGLAMDVCNGYERLTVNLKEAAITFAQSLLASDTNLTESGRKRMQLLASTSTESDTSLELKFIQMPKMHQLLNNCLQPPMTEMMRVYGSLHTSIMTPLPEKCSLVQKLLSDMINSHRDGLSWEGDIDIGDVDVYDDRVSISKEPKSFRIHPKTSPLMISAMERDFNWIAQSVLKKFRVHGALIPYLEAFITMLSEMASYASWWSNTETAEALRELIENHPFLKPAMARANLWSGIFCACSSHDAEDINAEFKTVLNNYVCESWTEQIQYNKMLRCIFKYKNEKSQPGVTAGCGADGPAAGPTASTVGSAAGNDGPVSSTVGSAAGAAGQAENPLGYYEDNAEFLIECLRHLFHHGSGYSFAYRPPHERGNGPRVQLMKSLDETELAGAAFLDEYAMEALTELLKQSAMKGLALSVWECYKNCNYPYRPQKCCS